MLDSQGSYLRIYLNLIRQHHFKIVLAFLLTSGTALVVSFHLPRSYESSTLFEVIESQRSSPLSTNLFQSVFSGGVNRGDMETLARRFSTESLLHHVIDQLEMDANPGAEHLPSPGKLRASVKARIVPDTSYISLGVRLTEASGGERNAALIANELVHTLQSWRALEEQQKATSRRAIVDLRLTQLQQQMGTLQEDLLEFMQERGSPVTWYPLLNNLLERRKELFAAIRVARTTLEAAEEEERAIEQRLQEQPMFSRSAETLTTDPIWMDLQTRLMTVDAEIADMTQRHGAQSPQLRGLESKREVVQQQVHEYLQRTVRTETLSTSPLYLQLVQRKWAVEAQVSLLSGQMDSMRQEREAVDLQMRELLDKLPGQQYDFDLIKRKIEALYSVLLELQKQSIEAEMLLAEARPPEKVGLFPVQGGIVVIDRAVPSKAPVSPNQRFIVMLGAMVGLGLGILWTVVEELVVRTGSLGRNDTCLQVPKNS